MPTYILLSTLTDEGARTLKQNPKRLQEVNKELEKFGAKVVGQYATLGPYDFVSVIEAPDNDTVAHLSAELHARGTIRILTLPAIQIANFVRRMK
jgi:uncharacterized protein with GYD domain